MSVWRKIVGALSIQPKLSDDELFLKKVSFMRGLTNKQITIFSRFVHERHFEPGEYIFKEDYPHVVLYFIKQGEIELQPHSHSKEHVIKLKKYQYVGIEELFLNSKRWSSAIAKTECYLLAISKYDFKTFIKRDPRAGIKVLYGLCTTFSRYLKHYLTEEVEDIENEIR